MAVTGQQISEEAAKPIPYFSHDNNAAEDIKCQRLLIRGGFEAYGRWWRVCELMAMYTGHHIPYATDEDFLILGKQLMCESTKELGDFVKLLADVELISIDALGRGEIASDRMNRNASALGFQRAAGKLGGRPRKTDNKSNQ